MHTNKYYTVLQYLKRAGLGALKVRVMETVLADLAKVKVRS
jgi:hypothetical protein